MEYNWNQIREVQFAGKIYVENQVTVIDLIQD